MKTMLTALAIGALGTTLLMPASAQRQQKSPEELRKQYEEKISKDWFKSASWSLDLEDSLARATKEGKPVLAYFTRSYSP